MRTSTKPRAESRRRHPGDPRPATCLLLLGLGAACATSGQAPSNAGGTQLVSPNRPTFGDSPSLLPTGRAQFETGYTFAQRRGGGTEVTRQTAPELTARYGVGETVEARLLWGGMVWSQDDSGTAGGDADGGGEAAAAVLTPLTSQHDCWPALTLELLSTLGVGDTTFSSGHAEPTAKLLWAYGGGHLPDWLTIGGNLIVGYPTEHGDRFTQPAASLAVTLGQPTADTNLFAEWYWIGRPANLTAATQSVDFGVVHRLAPDLAIDGRVGCGLDSRADDVLAGFGISFLF